MRAPRPFSVLEIAIVSGIVNALINAPIGWFVVKPGASLPLWGVPSIFGDLLAMSFGISFGTVLAVTWQTRRQVARGQLLPPELSPEWTAALGRWPRSTWRRAIWLGALSVAVFAPPTLLLVWACGLHSADRAVLAEFKGVYSFVQGAIVTPIVAAAAIVGQPAPDAAPVAVQQ